MVWCSIPRSQKKFQFHFSVHPQTQYPTLEELRYLYVLSLLKNVHPCVHLLSSTIFAVKMGFFFSKIPIIATMLLIIMLLLIKRLKAISFPYLRAANHCPFVSFPCKPRMCFFGGWAEWEAQGPLPQVGRPPPHLWPTLAPFLLVDRTS